MTVPSQEAEGPSPVKLISCLGVPHSNFRHLGVARSCIIWGAVACFRHSGSTLSTLWVPFGTGRSQIETSFISSSALFVFVVLFHHTHFVSKQAPLIDSCLASKDKLHFAKVVAELWFLPGLLLCWTTHTGWQYLLYLSNILD